MRLGILSLGVSLLVLGVGGVANASDNGRFAGIGAGITYAHDQQPLNTDRPDGHWSSRAPAPAPKAVVHRRGLVGLNHLGAGSGLDPVTRDGSEGRGDMLRTASGGAAPLPPDLNAVRKPQGDLQSDRPSPMIAARDSGGVVGLSYKIKPQ
jgi:hypothetical protein